MLKKPSRNSGAARKLSDEQIVELIMQLGGQLHDVSLRCEALRAVVERHGISREEIEQAYEHLRSAGAAQIVEGLKRALAEQSLAMLRKHEGTKQ